MDDSVGTATYWRVWWPHQLRFLPNEGRRWLIVGWVVESTKSADIVVISGLPSMDESSRNIVELQELLESIELKLPANLRREGELSVVGEYVTTFENVCEERPNQFLSSVDRSRQDEGKPPALVSFNYRKRQMWAIFSGHLYCNREVDWVPNLRYIFNHDCHVVPQRAHFIIYDQPRLGTHYYSSLAWTSVNDQKISVSHVQKQNVKKPIWLSEMENQASSFDMELIILQLNCARFIDKNILAFVTQNSRTGNSYYSSRIDAKRPVWAVIIICATVLYCLARGVMHIFTVWLPSVPFIQKGMRKSMLLQTIEVHCRQLMAWPFSLMWGGTGPTQPNVAVAKQLIIQKNSTWCSILADKVAGAALGWLVLKYRTLILDLLKESGQSLTNDVLRTGCVWLSVAPAGFKINTEFATVVGTLSLHWIQTWSTFFYELLPAFRFVILFLGLSGIVMGFTVLMSFISDMILVTTMHVLCLHNAIRYLYSNQLRALAALFRLFRGRKRNALCGRKDSFDFTVEQLIVGSLLFTPLLLLLPTTTVFYTYFSTIFVIVSCLRSIIHYSVSVFLAFPFFEVFTWFFYRKEFPSGVWMDFVQVEFSCMHDPRSAASVTFHKRVLKRSKLGEAEQGFYDDRSPTRAVDDFSPESDASNDCGCANGAKVVAPLITKLEIRTASLGELLIPFFNTHHYGLQWPSLATSAYKVVTGDRFIGNFLRNECFQYPYRSLDPKRFAHLCYTALKG